MHSASHSGASGYPARRPSPRHGERSCGQHAAAPAAAAQLITYTVRPFIVPQLRAMSGHLAAAAAADAAAPTKLHPVFMAPLKITGAAITFNAEQQIYSQHLAPCKDIIDQHVSVWFSKKPGATARKLRTAATLVNGLMSTIASMNDKEKMVIHLHAAMRNKKWKDIIACIHSFKGASEQEKKLVVDHRRKLQNHLLTFIEALKDLHDVYLVESAEMERLKWPDFVRAATIEIEEVAVDEDIEGEVEADDAAPAGVYN
jgi:hypothetical protein